MGKRRLRNKQTERDFNLDVFNPHNYGPLPSSCDALVSLKKKKRLGLQVNPLILPTGLKWFSSLSFPVFKMRGCG